MRLGALFCLLARGHLSLKRLQISNVHICNKNICYKISLLLVREMQKNKKNKKILGTPFLLYFILIQHL